MSENQAYFIQNFEARFGDYEQDHEQMQPHYRAIQPHHGLTETQFFGFSIPDKGIHAFLYLWLHPNLDVVSGGPIVWQGFKSIQHAAELFDYRSYLPLSKLEGDLTHYRLESSYSVEMTEPGRAFRLSYEDPLRGNAFDLSYQAVSEVMMWPSSRHYEQVMKVDGTLHLRGERHVVDGFNIRGRSWGEARLENPNPGPPACWMIGTFGPDFAFNITAADHPDLDPVWKDVFDVDPATVSKFGWMIVDGEAVTVERTIKRTTYHAQTLMPERIEMEVFDTKGRKHDIVGTMKAALPFNTWPNLRVPICLAQWECKGRIGHGDTQEAQWTDFITAFHQEVN